MLIFVACDEDLQDFIISTSLGKNSVVILREPKKPITHVDFSGCDEDLQVFIETSTSFGKNSDVVVLLEPKKPITHSCK